MGTSLAVRSVTSVPRRVRKGAVPGWLVRRPGAVVSVLVSDLGSDLGRLQRCEDGIAGGDGAALARVGGDVGGDGALDPLGR